MNEDDDKAPSEVIRLCALIAAAFCSAGKDTNEGVIERAKVFEAYIREPK